MGAKFELTEHLERALCDEEQAEALLPHLLGLERKPPDERDAEACWEEVRKLSAKETDGVPLLPEELSPLPDSLGEMAVSQRAALLLALAEAWLAQRSDEAPALRQGAVDGAGGADLLRAERLGADGDGRTYWYMHDLRVYREAPGKPVDAARAQQEAAGGLRVGGGGGGDGVGVARARQDAEEQGRRGRAEGGDPEPGGGGRGARGPRSS